jgi:hypothetical protein
VIEERHLPGRIGVVHAVAVRDVEFVVRNRRRSFIRKGDERH